MIKPIETIYKGYRFRSRLEARWAVFFDAIGAEWQYEPEGFELPCGKYLPDFFVKEFGHGGYFEVKPDIKIENDWLLKLQHLGDATKVNCFLLNGPPDFKFYKKYQPKWEHGGEEYKAEWSSVGFCGGDGNYENLGGYWTDPFDYEIEEYILIEKDKTDFFWDKYVQAVYKSRAARFEYNSAVT